MSDTDKKPAPRDDKLTRIPVRHVYFNPEQSMTFAGTTLSTLSNLKCYADPPSATTFATCSWIPAWQMFEFTFRTGGRESPKVRLVPVHRVSNWERDETVG